MKFICYPKKTALRGGFLSRGICLAEHALQVRAVVGDMFFHLRVLDDIVAEEGRQRREADKFVGLVEVQIDTIHADAAKEITHAGDYEIGRASCRERV